MDCGTTSAHKFRTKKGFKQNDVISTKEQSVLIKKWVYLKEKTCKSYIVFYVTELISWL